MGAAYSREETHYAGISAAPGASVVSQSKWAFGTAAAIGIQLPRA
jgi:hypothetical protein